jgi:hypothetical protein
MIGSQRIQVGLPHAGKTAEITIEADTYHITVDDELIFTAPGTSSRDIRRHKASRYAGKQPSDRSDQEMSPLPTRPLHHQPNETRNAQHHGQATWRRLARR